MDSKLNPFGAAFEWGTQDCCLSVANHLTALGLPDPMAAYRGRYKTERGAARIFAKEGGIETVITARMAENGYEISPDGFVGLVKTDHGPTACLRLGEYWFAQSQDGVQGYDPRSVYMKWTHPTCPKQSL